MLSLMVDAALPTILSALVVLAGLIGIALLPWTDEELDLASDAVRRAKHLIRTNARVAKVAPTSLPPARRHSATSRFHGESSAGPPSPSIPFPAGHIAIRRL